MKHIKSIIFLLYALCLWSCDNYVVDPTPAPILIDRAISVYYSAREVRVNTQNAQRVTLAYRFSNSLYCDVPFRPSKQLSSECKRYVAVANSYGEKEPAKYVKALPGLPSSVVTNVSRLQLLAVAAPNDTVDISQQAHLSFPTAQEFIASHYQNRVVSTVEGTFAELTREQLRWLPRDEVSRCFLPSIRDKELWLKTTFTDGSQSLTKVEPPR